MREGWGIIRVTAQIQKRFGFLNIWNFGLMSNLGPISNFDLKYKIYIT